MSRTTKSIQRRRHGQVGVGGVVLSQRAHEVFHAPRLAVLGDVRFGGGDGHWPPQLSHQDRRL